MDTNYKAYKRYDVEFKRNAVELLESSGRSISEVGRPGDSLFNSHSLQSGFDRSVWSSNEVRFNGFPFSDILNILDRRVQCFSRGPKILSSIALECSFDFAFGQTQPVLRSFKTGGMVDAVAISLSRFRIVNSTRSRLVRSSSG
jgi:hypothetical protein